MASHEELVSNFTDITGVEPGRARFYLESSAWKLEVALASFYENDEPTTLIAAPAEDSSEDDYKEAPENIVEGAKYTEMEEKLKPKSKIATLNDLKEKEGSPDEEEGQSFYAGGSKNSGQQVLGPGKKKDIVSDMFKSCQGQSVDVKPKPKGQQRPNTFSGAGYKLGQTNSDTEVIASTSNHPQSNSGPITLKLWKDGFTINDSELRLYSDPENREFLDTIKRGEIPAEIRQEIQSTEAWLDMEDHRHEIYVPPKVKVKAFTGKGHMLGSPSPATVGMTIPTDLADQTANECQAKKQLNVDESKPVTTLQIRLADGTSVKAQFNLTHTVNDLRQYIVTMRPQYAMREFSLLTTYPTKELSGDKTIGEAGLQNTAIIQRLK
ncbi:PREDICTED: NSFL1 cofactor p47 [Dufourea novaeangliae]|uniref:NSFL1 cofactor p47 n=1 Tax=Dufourea novaeangliae TaxID=178035 RepID=A0A154PIP1_DUFNO|nr:PREDICTED: NSFL1 cofactor p47 [Dufourea novaeangliae]KZC11188.1 NSFL1 cofactor p47 [Dufourea novaeangliae]